MKAGAAFLSDPSAAESEGFSGDKWAGLKAEAIFA